MVYPTCIHHGHYKFTSEQSAGTFRFWLDFFSKRVGIATILWLSLSYLLDLEMGLDSAEKHLGKFVAGECTAADIVLEIEFILDLFRILVGNAEVGLARVL